MTDTGRSVCLLKLVALVVGLSSEALVRHESDAGVTPVLLPSNVTSGGCSCEVRSVALRFRYVVLRFSCVLFHQNIVLFSKTRCSYTRDPQSDVRISLVVSHSTYLMIHFNADIDL